MSGASPPEGDPHDPAAELALGVLDGEERAAAERRLLTDPAFSREVEGWSLRLAAIAAEAAPREPPAAVWPRIESRLDAGAGAEGGAGAVVELRLRRSLGVWRAIAGGAGAIAAALAVVLAMPHQAAPPAPAAPPAAPVVARTGGGVLEAASLSSPKGGQIAFIAVYDPERRELVLTPATLGRTSGRSPELWVIPAGGEPIPLGVGQFGKPVRLKVDALTGKAAGTLAVSIEPEGGSPSGKPTGPVVATGQLQAL